MKYLALFLIFLFQAAHAEAPAPWRIAIIGDTHDSPKRMEGSEGVAVNFIKTLYGEMCIRDSSETVFFILFSQLFLP